MDSLELFNKLNKSEQRVYLNKLNTISAYLSIIGMIQRKVRKLEDECNIMLEKEVENAN